jgi:hypothetical protein
MRPQALLFALLAVATAASGAGVYRWVDEKGGHPLLGVAAAGATGTEATEAARGAKPTAA